MSRHAADSCSLLSFSLLGWLFDPFQKRSWCEMSQYPCDIFHVSFSSGPWRKSLQSLISLTSQVWTVTPLVEPYLPENYPSSDHQRCPWLEKLFLVVVVVEYKVGMVTGTRLLWSLILVCLRGHVSVSFSQSPANTHTHTHGHTGLQVQRKQVITDSGSTNLNFCH